MTDLFETILGANLPTYEEEQKRLLEYIPDDFYKEEGSIFWDIFSAIAYDNINLYKKMKQIFYNSFGLTATGDALSLKVQEVGLERKQGTKATGVATFKGLAGTKIYNNTVVLCDTLQYVTVNDHTVAENGTVDVPIVAVSVGSAYNIGVNKINTVGVTIQGINEVTNKQAITNGTNDETDDELRARYLMKVREPATSGNAYHYKKWALEIQGIGTAKVYPLWNGAGTVKVVVVGNNGQAVEPQKIKEVVDHIELLRPIGATVTVENAKAKNINIRCKVVINSLTTIDIVREEIKKKINEYLSTVNISGSAVNYGKIAGLIFTVAGVEDFSSLTINSSTESITLEDGYIAVLTGCDINV